MCILNKFVKARQNCSRNDYYDHTVYFATGEKLTSIYPGITYLKEH